MSLVWGHGRRPLAAWFRRFWQRHVCGPAPRQPSRICSPTAPLRCEKCGEPSSGFFPTCWKCNGPTPRPLTHGAVLQRAHPAVPMVHGAACCLDCGHPVTLLRPWNPHARLLPCGICSGRRWRVRLANGTEILLTGHQPTQPEEA